MGYIIASWGYRSRGATEVGVWKGLCWRVSFRRIEQQGAIEVEGYRSRGLERIVLEGELLGDIAADCAEGGPFWGYSSRGL